MRAAAEARQRRRQKIGSIITGKLQEWSAKKFSVFCENPAATSLLRTKARIERKTLYEKARRLAIDCIKRNMSESLTGARIQSTS